jgi:hypothetical protein
VTAAKGAAAGLDAENNSKYGSRRHHAKRDPFDF